MPAFAGMTWNGWWVKRHGSWYKFALLNRFDPISKVFCALFFKKALLSFLLQRAAAAAYGGA
jgi:hypothetical protein